MKLSTSDRTHLRHSLKSSLQNSLERVPQEILKKPSRDLTDPLTKNWLRASMDCHPGGDISAPIILECLFWSCRARFLVAGNRMAVPVDVLDVAVLDNPGKYTDKFRFSITFECLKPLSKGKNRSHSH